MPNHSNAIPVRPANVVTETFDGHGDVTETVKTFNLGHWEMMQIQRGLELLKTQATSDDEADAARHMSYFDWLIGSCERVEITVTAKYES